MKGGLWVPMAVGAALGFCIMGALSLFKIESVENKLHAAQAEVERLKAQAERLTEDNATLIRLRDIQQDMIRDLQHTPEHEATIKGFVCIEGIARRPTDYSVWPEMSPRCPGFKPQPRRAALPGFVVDPGIQTTGVFYPEEERLGKVGPVDIETPGGSLKWKRIEVPRKIQ